MENLIEVRLMKEAQEFLESLEENTKGFSSISVKQCRG